MQSFELDVSGSSGRRFVTYLRAKLREAHRVLNPPLRELSVALVGDKRMSQLHQEYMGLAGPTDVLTFPLELARGGKKALSGEVVVCVPEARRQARARGMAVERELLLYSLHGMLHLCGFDDRTEAGFRRMHAKEDEILIQLGVGATFASPEPSAHGLAVGQRRRQPHRRPRAEGAAGW